MCYCCIKLPIAYGCDFSVQRNYPHVSQTHLPPPGRMYHPASFRLPSQVMSLFIQSVSGGPAAAVAMGSEGWDSCDESSEWNTLCLSARGPQLIWGAPVCGVNHRRKTLPCQKLPLLLLFRRPHCKKQCRFIRHPRPVWFLSGGNVCFSQGIVIERRIAEILRCHEKGR